MNSATSPVEIKQPSPNETLAQKQRRFTFMIARLISYAYSHDYELTFGDAFRDPRLYGQYGLKRGYGEAKSLHKLRLAVDFNLFKNGKFLTSTEDHKFLGEFWEMIGGTWGGRFNDGNHYSLGHDGQK
jgi:hypothetical protein